MATLFDAPHRHTHSIDMDWWSIPQGRRDAIFAWIVRNTGIDKARSCRLGEGWADVEYLVCGEDGEPIIRAGDLVVRTERFPVDEPPPDEWWPDRAERKTAQAADCAQYAIMSEAGPLGQSSVARFSRSNRSPPHRVNDRGLADREGVDVDNPTCTIDGCAKVKKYAKLGWCNMHYARWRNSGTTSSFKDLTAEERFLAYVDKDAPSGCWIWNGGQSRGYGFFRPPNGKQGTAYRYSYELYVGQVPEGFQIDHLCRVKLCVNPDHLEAVTQAENLRRGHRARQMGDQAWRRQLLSS